MTCDYGGLTFNLIVYRDIDLSFRIERKGHDHLCEGCIVAPINQQSANREGDQDDQA